MFLWSWCYNTAIETLTKTGTIIVKTACHSKESLTLCTHNNSGPLLHSPLPPYSPLTLS